jgi:uncharacterized protein with HEPN domain
MPKTPAIEERLADIIRWGERLARHLHGMTRDQFMASEMVQDAASKCAEAVGEAAREILKIDPEFDSNHPELRLRSAMQSRHRLSHGYRSINVAILWNTATESVPRTVKAAKDILRPKR